MRGFYYTLTAVSALFVLSTYFEKGSDLTKVDVIEDEGALKPSTEKNKESKVALVAKEKILLSEAAPFEKKEVSPKIYSETIDIDDREILRIDNADVKSKFGKTYKKVSQVIFSKGVNKKITLKFSKKIKSVASVVLVASEGSITPLKFSLNSLKSKEFEDGEDMFKDDWIKLEGPDEGLAEIVIVAKGQKTDGVLDVYIQKLNETEE